MLSFLPMRQPSLKDSGPFTMKRIKRAILSQVKAIVLKIAFNS